ncbi:heavy-metal-associated domain-containing protein [Xylaria sp. FL1777]|nr:heavy-metal-associated domain-containing protein [Xylaria sp. FL1777]
MTQNKVKTPFETLFAVHMTCDSCVKSVSEALFNLDGIATVDANLKDQLVAVKGTVADGRSFVPTAAPSAIVSAIEATGRDAILRGSGASNSAAVCILETYHRNERGGDALVPASDPEASTGDSAVSEREVRGLARMVQVSPTATLIDLTLRGVAPGRYNASIREYGDLKFGATSTGPIWAGGSDDTQPRGVLGSVEVGQDGRGAAFLDHPIQVWEVIGHAIVLSSQQEGQGELKNDENTVVGVIARSAGMWDNDKTVCSCTGKTLWEERKDEVQKGMI